MSRVAAGPGGERALGGETTRRLWACTAPYAGKRRLLFGLVLLRAVQLPCITWAIGAIISGPIARRDLTGTWLSVLLLLGLVVFTELTFVWRIRLALELAESVVRDLRTSLFAHLLRMPLAFFQKTQVGSLVSRLVNDIDAVRTGVQEVVFIGIVQLGTALIAALLMLYYDWALFLVVLTIVPVLWALLKHFRTKLSKALREVQESFSRVTSTLAEAVGGMREIQSFVRQDVNGGLFRGLVQDHSRYNMNVARQSATFLPLLEFNGQLFVAILIVIGGYRALGHEIGLEALIQFFFLANLFFNPIPLLGQLYNQALSSLAGAERVFALLDTAPAWRDDRAACELPPSLGKVEFRGVSFEYEPGQAAVHDLDFVAEPGQLVALVGESGAGKSTILSLLGKLYLPSAGRILIDGVEIRKLESEALHSRMAIVPQNSFLFSGTVLDNIRFGRPSASDAEVRAAVEALGVADLIECLSDGYQTRIAERGGGLSLGQRQVVCFARALLARPELVLLDEATSAMDSITEARVQEALARLLRGRTSFVVAHRLSTIRGADTILVLERGRIVERGRHDELLRAGGVYAGLCRQLEGRPA